jgi:hypothetical protein
MTTAKFLRFLAIPVLVAACSNNGAPRQVTLQELATDPVAYSGSVVQLEGCLLADRHGMAIADCNEHEALIGVEFSDNKELSGFIRMAQHQWAPGTHSVLKARVTGTFTTTGTGGSLKVDQAEKLPP